MIAGLALLLLAAPSAAATAPIDLPAGRTVEWTYERHPGPVQYRNGDLVITVRAIRLGGDNGGLIEPRVTVTKRGRRPLTIRGGPISPVMPHGLTVGQLDRSGTRYVMWQAYTGGAHCCFRIRLLIPEGIDRGVVELGTFDTPMLEEAPSDIDGDGRADFVIRDNRFLYAFGSYAGSFAPPQIWNVMNGRVLDVSAWPGFRTLFVDQLRETREPCLAGGEEGGACASYAASAARLGRFDEVWPQIRRVQPAQADAIRTFLVRHDYLPR